MVGLGFGGLVVCVQDKKLGKCDQTQRTMAAAAFIRRRYGTTPPATKHATINLNHMRRVYIVETRKKFITSNLMHIALTSKSDDDDAATRQWAPCRLLNDIVDSNSTLSLPTIYSTRAGRGGRGGRGLWTSNLSGLGMSMGTLGFFR